MNNDLTLVIPAKNEKESLPFVIKEIKKLNFKTPSSCSEKTIITIPAAILSSAE